MEPVVDIALIGAGMFGADVHARTFADLQRAGISPHLGRLGLDGWARDFAGVQFRLVAVAARSEASARRLQQSYRDSAGAEPRAYSGERPWLDVLRDFPRLKVLSVATPDHLHAEAILAGLRAGAHVLTEKPMCLEMDQADAIIEMASTGNRIVAVDMHKRYDPDHLRIRQELLPRLGTPLYGSAFLEEPVQLSTQTFKWAAQSDPFTYVGVHWVDLLYHYFHSKPASLTAVGQKARLAAAGIDTYDAVQVRLDFANGLSVSIHTNWVTPTDFEGPVNQGHEIVGTEGKVESDQQYRGLRWWHSGGGSRTANTHFTRDVQRPDGSTARVGYGVDSLVAGLAAICRVEFQGARRSDLAGLYPTAEEARVGVAVVHAARRVCDLNYRYLQEGRGAPVTARFGTDGIAIVDPFVARAGLVEHRIYERAL